MRKKSSFFIKGILAFSVISAVVSQATVLTAQIKFRKCPPFHLRTETGAIINPITGQNADKPFSTRQTCGVKGCHSYDMITKGYHFQQGWDRIKDDFSKKKPWVLSDGMMGKY